MPFRNFPEFSGEKEGGPLYGLIRKLVLTNLLIVFCKLVLTNLSGKAVPQPLRDLSHAGASDATALMHTSGKICTG